MEGLTEYLFRQLARLPNFLEKATCEEQGLPAKQSVRFVSDRGRNPASPLFDRLFCFSFPIRVFLARLLF